MKKFLAFFICVFITVCAFAQEESVDVFSQKSIYSYQVYGQAFEIFELTYENKFAMMIVMSDNKTKTVKTFDMEYPTDFFIFSDWYDSKKEYSAIVNKTIDFLSSDMNLISLADMKDICDIAPCCELTTYKFREDKNVISICYICVDMEQLYDVARIYNAKGRAYALKRYAEEI